MPLIQGGPPQWIWERTPDPMKFEINPTRSPEGEAGEAMHEIRILCGLDILRLEFFTVDELRAFQTALEEAVDRTSHNGKTACPENRPAPVRTGVTQISY